MCTAESSGRLEGATSSFEIDYLLIVWDIATHAALLLNWLINLHDSILVVLKVIETRCTRSLTFHIEVSVVTMCVQAGMVFVVDVGVYELETSKQSLCNLFWQFTIVTYFLKQRKYSWLHFRALWWWIFINKYFHGSFHHFRCRRYVLVKFIYFIFASFLTILHLIWWVLVSIFEYCCIFEGWFDLFHIFCHS